MADDVDKTSELAVNLKMGKSQAGKWKARLIVFNWHATRVFDAARIASSHFFFKMRIE